MAKGETKKERAKRLAANRRNKFRGINPINIAEGYAQTAVWTEAFFHTNPIEFVTGMADGTYNPGSDGGSTITLPELAGFRTGGHSGKIGGSYGSYADNALDAVSRNLSGGIKATEHNWMTASWGLVRPAVTSAIIGGGFRWGKKLTSAPRAKVNKFIREQLKLGDFIRI